MFKRTALSTAIVVAMGVSAGSTIAVAEEVEKLEKIQVTGSRISRVDVEGPAPVLVFDRKNIERSGAATISEFLRENPSIGGAANISEVETLSQVAGSSGVDYRGFGKNAVLILLNGRRLPNNPIASTFVDLNQLPSAAVERVEVLNDGASAIYGSDAVSGVINIITRSDYEGATVSLHGGITDKKDGQQKGISVVTGKSFDKARVLFSFDAFGQDVVNAKDRSFSKSALSRGEDGRSPFGVPATVYNPATNTAAPAAACSNPVHANKVYGPTAKGQWCNYDFAKDYQLIPKSKRYSFFTLTEYDFNENLTGYAQMRYNFAETQTANAAAPGFIAVTVTDANRNNIPASVGANVGDKVLVARRWNEFGKREKDNENNTGEAVFGLKGMFDLTVLGETNWQAEVGHSRARNVQKGTRGQLIKSEITKGVENGDINIFDPSKNSPETIAKYQQNPWRKGVSRLTFANIRADGYFDEYDIGWAAGLEGRKETYYDKTSADFPNIIGGASGNGGGSRRAKASYLEVSSTAIDKLELGAAIRFDSYSDFGKKFTGKLSAGYRPVDDVLIRASYGTGFKAPDMKDLYLGQSKGVVQAKDVKACADAGIASDACPKKEVTSVSGGNPNLKPEESKSFNAGIVVQLTDDLSTSVDYWNIALDNQVKSIGVQEILNNRDKYGHLIGKDENGRLKVTDILQNVSKSNGQGIDFSVMHKFDNEYGEFSTKWTVNHLLSFKRTKGISDKLCEEAGTYGEPKWKSSVSLDWDKSAWGANATVKYIGSYNDNGDGRTGNSCKFKNTKKVDSYVTLDVQGSYDFSKELKVAMGIKNLAGTKPPFTKENRWPWFNKKLHNPAGRFFYAKMEYTF